MAGDGAGAGAGSGRLAGVSWGVTVAKVDARSGVSSEVCRENVTVVVVDSIGFAGTPVERGSFTVSGAGVDGEEIGMGTGNEGGEKEDTGSRVSPGVCGENVVAAVGG